MRILLLINEHDDLDAVGEYIGRRFNKTQIDIDVLAVMRGHMPASRGPEDQAARTGLNTVAHTLRDTWGIRSVQTHLEHGDLVDIALELSRDCRSDLILACTQLKNGILFNGFDRTTRRLFRKANCSVELLRCDRALPIRRFNVVVPLLADQIESFPLDRLRSLAWVDGTQIILLAVMRPAVDASRLEASPAAVLNDQEAARKKKAEIEGNLSAICLELTEDLGDKVDVDFEIAEGEFQVVTEATVRKTRSTLLVLGVDSNTRKPGGQPGSVDHSGAALAAGCSVLFFKAPKAATRALEGPYTRVTPITGS